MPHVNRVPAHVVPYALFVGVGALSPLVPELWRPWLDPVRALTAGIALLFLFRRGAFPELSDRGTTASHPTLLALVAGLIVGLSWIPLTPDWLPPLGTRNAFESAAAGDGFRPVLWVARALGLIAVVPFVEELFVRSFLPRYVDAGRPHHEWWNLPVGRFTRLSFAISVGFFTLTHAEWFAALVAGVLWTLLLMKTRRLRDAVLAHAVANATLLVWVVRTGEKGWI